MAGVGESGGGGWRQLDLNNNKKEKERQSINKYALTSYEQNTIV